MLEEQNSGPQAKTVFEQMLRNAKGNIVSFERILPKDTLVVLDFCASWCVPCIEEFSFTNAIEQKLISKPVKFIRLSGDEHQADWQ